MTKFFITGTDTDCGKTYVTCRLLQYFNQKGISAQALKPVASGCEEEGGDIQALQSHNADKHLNINHWSFKPPIAPHIAARMAHQSIQVSELQSFVFKKEFEPFEFLLIEGAGGLMVPLNEKETWVDFIQAALCPVILVVGIKLGCINHALLTDAFLESKKLPYLGWIANHLSEKTSVDEAIIDTLNAKMHKPLLTSVSYCGNINWSILGEK